MANDITNVKIEPADFEWGNPEVTKITAIADVSDSLDALHYTMYATDGTQYYVWFDASGTAVDPNVTGATGIEVTIDTDDTAAEVAALAVTAIAAIAAFNCKIDPDDANSYIMQNVGVGTVTAVVTDIDSTFTILQLRAGSSLQLGFTDGDTEIGVSEDLFDVMAQQSGTQVIDRIRTGKTVENITIPMKESTAAKLQVILEAGGASVTPGAGTKFTGWGKSKRFLNISADCRQLIVHPVRNAASNLINDWVFWRAYPNLAGFNFSGESDQLINVEFQVIPDPLILEAQELFGYGDHEQNLLRE